MSPAAVSQSREELIVAVSKIRSVYTPYPRLNQIQKAISRLVLRPSGSSEGAVYALLGETRSGKSQLLRVIKSDYPRERKAIQNEDGDFADRIPVLVVKLPNASVKACTERIYKGLTSRSPESVLGSRYTQPKVEDEIVRLASECQLRLLVLDEAHQSIDQKTDSVAEAVAVLVKDLSNAAKFSILVVGTENAKRLLAAKDELASRVHKVFFLRRFERRRSDLDVWLDILRDIDGVLERKVFGRSSKLDSLDMAEALMTAADGVVGHMATLIENAAYEAVDEMIESGKPGRVDWSHLELAFREWQLGQGRVNPFSETARPPANGNDLLPERTAEEERQEEEEMRRLGSETVMSGARGRSRRNDRDSMFRN